MPVEYSVSERLWLMVFVEETRGHEVVVLIYDIRTVDISHILNEPGSAVRLLSWPAKQLAADR